MKCHKCETENREEANYCQNCGEILGRQCKQCGKMSQSSAKFCDSCGAPISDDAKDLEVNYSQPRSYTPRGLAEKILSSRPSIEGERKFVTVLFIDVANYTSISEHLDPEEIHQIMDLCFRLVMDQIHRYEGTITQFTGDGVMALFGAPIAHEDHAQRACYAALAIKASMKDFSNKMWLDYGIEFSIRTGINTGLVIVGSIGDDLHMDYTALGDTTNLASRMESMASPGSIFVSRDTHKLTKDYFRFKELGNIMVKGKTDPIEAFEIIGAGEIETRFGASVARGLTKFVGREKELRSLEKTFKKVQAGSGQVIGIVGEAGVGKSRLILEFRNLISDKSNTYLEGRCFHFGSTMAYLPIIDILRSYFDVSEGMIESTAKKNIEEKLKRFNTNLANVQPPFHELLSLGVEDESYTRLEPKLKRERNFEAVRDLLIKESQDTPLVLVFEDLHWIDKTSEEFLSYFIEWLPNIRILLILLYRPEYVHEWGNKSYYCRIGLGQLPAIASSEMVKSLLEGADVAPELRELIIGRAGGNPLFMEELTYALLEGGDIERANQQYTLSRKVWEIQVPETIQGIIAARMDRLEPSQKRTLQMAAVIGRDFSYGILEKIYVGISDLKSQLLALQAGEFIFEKSLFPEIEYTFKHALVQEVAYNSLLLRRRREIHEKIGNATEALFKERQEEVCEMLAYHYTKSENKDKAYHYLKISGMKAARSSSLWEAFRFFRDAISVLKGQSPTPSNAVEQIEITLNMIPPMLSLGFPEDSLYWLQNGESLAKEVNDTKGLITLCSAIGLYFSIKGDTVRGLQYNEECFKVAEKEQNIDLMAPVAFDLCSNYSARGEFVKVSSIAPGIMTLLEESGKESEGFGRGYNLYTAFAAFYGFSTTFVGEYDKGRLIFDKGLAFAEKIGNLYSLGLIEVFYAYSYCQQGDGAKALPHFEKAISYLEKGQIFVLLGLAWSGVGWAHYFMGNTEKALVNLEKGLEIHSEANVTYNLSVHHWFLSAVHCDLGNLDIAYNHVEEAIKLAQRNLEIYYEGLATMTFGRILGKQGVRLREAEDAILKGIRIVDDLRVRPQVGIGNLILAELYGGMNQFEKAFMSLKIAEAIFQETSMDTWLAKARLALEMFQKS